MTTFKIFDKTYASRLFMAGPLEAQFRDHEAQVPAALAYRMSRGISSGEFVIEDKVVPFDPDSWRKDRRLIWCSNVSSANGYGMVAENTIKELLAAGVDVVSPGAVSGGAIQGGEYVDPGVARALRLAIEPDCLEIQHCQPPSFQTGIAQRSWIYSMFETDHTPRSWIPMLNRAERVLVPSSWLVDSWKEQGVTVPIGVYGHGVDPAVYFYRERPERDGFTFLHYGQLSLRKGTDLVYEAFKAAFAGRRDVRLILKGTYPICPVPLDLPNVEFVHATYSKERMADLLFAADCLVYPTRGEGFGLPGLEALATGLPIIVTNWIGPVDYADPDDTLLLDYTMARSREFDLIYKDYLETGEDTGWWAEPSLECLIERMKWAVEHRSQLREMGARAAARIADRWSWRSKCKELIDLIEQAA